MSIAGRDIICLSTHWWDDNWFRKQHFMSRFARRNRVLFVEPTFSIGRRPSVRGDCTTNRVLRPRLERRGERLHLLKPPQAIPKWGALGLEARLFGRYGRLVGEVAGRLGFREPILWVYDRKYWHGLAFIPHRQLVFDLADDLAAYPGTRSRAIEACVAGLAGAGDLMVVTAARLRERYGPLARRIVQVPNGFDADLFDGAERAPPPELAQIPRPIVGFVGVLFAALDFDLLEHVARAHADKSIVLAGPVDSSAARAVRRLGALPNVWHLGPVRKPRIPALVSAFDVCLCPFRSGELADSVSPLKVYEYLAMGRPVVSGPMASLRAEPLADSIAFADERGRFAAAVQASIERDSPAARAARRRAVASHSWDRLFERLDEACAAALM